MGLVVAAVLFAATVVVSLIALIGAGMSDNPANNSAAPALWVFGVGTTVSLLIALSHWFPIGW